MFRNPARVVRIVSLLGLSLMHSGIARADFFSITFNDLFSNNVGTGQLSTDGVCAVCSAPPGTGLLTFSATIQGMNFDIASDVTFVPIVFTRSSSILEGLVADTDTSTALVLGATGFFTLGEETGLIIGTYTVTPARDPAGGVPEPTSIALVGSSLALLRFRNRLRRFGL